MSARPLGVRVSCDGEGCRVLLDPDRNAFSLRGQWFVLCPVCVKKTIKRAAPTVIKVKTKKRRAFKR